jgi:hypothetical protein
MRRTRFPWTRIRGETDVQGESDDPTARRSDRGTATAGTGCRRLNAHLCPESRARYSSNETPTGDADVR